MSHERLPTEVQGPDLNPLQFPATEPSGPAAEASQPGGLTVGRYRLLGELARGGMGIVYRAYDPDLDREVAVKLLQDRFSANSTAAQRFAQEARITSRLQHPGIPPVHEIGALPDRRPFLAMKLIKGRTLAHLLAERTDAAEDRGRFVAIFEQVCQAVAYAHSRGVIHRDLKPANVMVGEFAEVQVMDWGIAKGLAGRETDTGSAATIEPTSQTISERSPNGSTLMPGSGTANQQPAGSKGSNGDHTSAGSVLGTPGYMSPEQARGDVSLIDRRSDVFGLGAILCTILTEAPPFTGSDPTDVMKRAAAGDLGEARRRLARCTAEPELVALCGSCLAADPGGRPADAGAVATAVAAYRAGVEERLRQAETERTQALVREAEQRKRRRVVQWAAGLVAAVLLLGVAGTTIGLVRAILAKDAERTAKNQAQLAADAEREANEKTQKRLVQIEKGVELFAGMLSGINPRVEEKEGKPLYEQLRERAEKAADQLQAEAVADPQAEARLQATLGNTLRELGSYAKAVEVLERARATRERELGADHPATLDTLNSLAMAYGDAGRTADAIALLEQVRDARVKKLGADHSNTLTTLSNLATAYQTARRTADAIALYEQVRDAEVKKLGADHPDTLTTLSNLATAYQTAKRTADAIALHEQVRDARVKTLGADHPNTLTTLNNLAAAYQAAGRTSEAIPLYEQVRDAEVKKLGADHPNTLTILNNLAEAYPAAGRTADAIALHEQVRDARVKKLGADHPDTLTTLSNLATAYQTARRTADAIALHEQVRDARVKKLGADHPDTLTTLNNLAEAYQAAGRTSEAIPLYEQVRDAEVKKLGADHPDTLNILNNLAVAYWSLRRLDRSIPLFEDVLARVEKKQGRQHLHTLTTVANLGVNYKDAGRLAEAIPLLEEAYRAAKAHSTLRWVGPQLLDGYIQAGVAADAAGLVGELLSDARRQLPKDSPQLAGQLAQFGLLLQEAKKCPEAEPLLREALALREKTQPDAWTTFNTMSSLGGALLGQKKYTDAEPLLVKGYEGMKARERTIPPQGSTRIPQALDRLIEFYTAQNAPGEVKKYRAERAKYPDVAPAPRRAESPPGSATP